MGMAQTSSGMPDVSIDFIYDKEEQKGTWLGLTWHLWLLLRFLQTGQSHHQGLLH